MKDASTSCPNTGTGCNSCFNSILDFVFVAAAAKDWQDSSQIFVPSSDYCEQDPIGGPDHFPVITMVNMEKEVLDGNGFTDDTAPSPSHEELPQLKIVSLFPNPTGDESKFESADMINLGKQDVDLSGWKLRDAANKNWFLDDLGTILSNEIVQILWLCITQAIPFL